MTTPQRVVSTVVILAVGGFLFWRMLAALTHLAQLAAAAWRTRRTYGLDREPAGTLIAPAGAWTPLGVTGYEVRHDVSPIASIRWMSRQPRQLVVASDACGELCICDFPGAPRYADVCHRGHCMSVRRRVLASQP